MNPNLDGLFGPSPEMIGRQQYEMMRARAAQEAQMSNIDRANYGMRTAGATLGHVGAGMLGSGNPAIEEAKMREQVMAQGGDLTTSAGLKAKAMQFAQAGDQRTAMKLAIAAKQQEAQEAKARADAALETKNYATAEKEFALAEKALRENPNLAVTEVGVKGRPGYMQRVLFDKTKPDSPYQDIGEPYLSAAAARQTFNVTTGASESKQPLAYVDADGKVKWGTMAEARGKAPAAFDPTTKQMVASAVEQGKEVGGQRANVGKQEEALVSVKSAIDTLDKGIYSGFWGPIQKTAVSATPGMNKKVVENTDVFLAQIGETVIPRLKEFGGNDSNQELAFLQKVAGGDITMQPGAIKKVLESAEKKIQRGVDRVKSGMTPDGSRMNKDQQALQWANDNPTDPRAMAIKARLGVK